MTTTLTRPPTEPHRWLGNTNRSATRRPGRRHSVPHLALGALLVLACAGGFLAVSLNTGDRVAVLALAKPVTAGQQLTAADLREVSISVDSGMSVVDAAQADTVVGRTLSASLPAGAVLPAAAVGSVQAPSGTGVAALGLKPGAFPPDVAPGTHVAVIVVPSANSTGAQAAGSGSAPSTWPAVVTEVAPSPDGQTTVVSVQLNAASARQVAALPPGGVALVMTGGEH